MSDNETLMDALPKEIENAKEILAEYEKIGAAGVFGATMIKADIETAEKAMRNLDTVKMIEALQTLRKRR